MKILSPFPLSVVCETHRKRIFQHFLLVYEIPKQYAGLKNDMVKSKGVFTLGMFG